MSCDLDNACKMWHWKIWHKGSTRIGKGTDSLSSVNVHGNLDWANLLCDLRHVTMRGQGLIKVVLDGSHWCQCSIILEVGNILSVNYYPRESFMETAVIKGISNGWRAWYQLKVIISKVLLLDICAHDAWTTPTQNEDKQGGCSWSSCWSIAI